MKILTLDFEGSLTTGIREIGIVYEEAMVATRYEEHTIQDDHECINALNNILGFKPDVFISHNINTEKNLIKKYLPYSRKAQEDISMEWGPWIDTTLVYRTLYTQISNFDLKSLTKTFVQKEVDILAKQFCKVNKKKHHNALYDAICTHLLFARIQNRVSMSNFIQ